MIKLLSYQGEPTLIEVNRYPNNEAYFKMPVDHAEKEYYGIEWHYESDSEMFIIMCLIGELPSLKHMLYMPYLPNSRTDAKKYEDDVDTLRWFCKWINSLGFENVKMIDTHSVVGASLIDNSYAVANEAYAIMAIDEIVLSLIGNASMNEAPEWALENIVLFYPNYSAYKRYGESLNLREYKHTYGYTKRNWETGELSNLMIADPELIDGKMVVIIDDICSYGGTFITSADSLIAAGAKNVYLYVSHCEDTIWEGKLPTSGLIDHMYTTNSLIKENQKEDWLTILEANVND